MTVFFEPVCWGEEHAPFNAALLLSARAAWPGESPVFFAEEGHLAAVRQVIPPDQRESVHWKPVRIAARHEKRFGPRFRAEWKLMAEVSHHARRVGARRLIATGCSQPGLAAWRAYRLAYTEPPSFLVVIHSILRKLLSSHSGRLLLAPPLLRQFRLAILGETLVRAALGVEPRLAGHSVSLTHPYVFASPSAAAELRAPVRFGFIGLANAAKGFPQFWDLAAWARQAGLPAEFVLAGRLGSGCTEYERKSDPPVLMPANPTQRLPRETFERLVDSFHYVVVPYDPASYEWTASGSFLDVLSFAKPCLALRNSQLEVVFEKLGDIGYLCESPAGLRNVVGRLVAEPDPVRYESQRASILNNRSWFEPERVKTELASIFSELESRL